MTQLSSFCIELHWPIFPKKKGRIGQINPPSFFTSEVVLNNKQLMLYTIFSAFY